MPRLQFLNSVLRKSRARRNAGSSVLKYSTILWWFIEVMSTTGFFFIYCVYGLPPTQASHAHIFACDIYRRVLECAPCLRDAVDTAPQRQNQEGQRDEKFERKKKARRTGLLG